MRRLPHGKYFWKDQDGFTYDGPYQMETGHIFYCIRMLYNEMVEAVGLDELKVANLKTRTHKDLDEAAEYIKAFFLEIVKREDLLPHQRTQLQDIFRNIHLLTFGKEYYHIKKQLLTDGGPSGHNQVQEREGNQEHSEISGGD